jgi:hypothetical protein
MPGKGPLPQGQRQRARDEKAGGPWETLPAEGYEGEFPKLPRYWQQEVTVWERDPDTREKFAVTKLRRRQYLPQTRNWYETFARSPMATKFTETDWVRLADIAPMKDSFYRGNHALASEIRQQETKLGATVRDRIDMRMRIAKPPAAAEQPSAAGADGTVVNMADRKERLQKRAG